MIKHFFCGSFGAAIMLLSGCATPPLATPVSAVKYQSNSAVISTYTDSLSPAEMATITSRTVTSPYTLGPNDVLAVTVYLHPELDVPAPNSSISTSTSLTTGGGALIGGDGTTQLPLIGSIDVGGMTIGEASDAITAAYSKYLVDPKVSVQIEAPQSLRYYMLGAFTQPGIKYPGRPLDLLEALALGGSVDITNADLRQAYVAQGSIKYPVDLYALLVEGDLSQNIPLASGDTIVVPTAASEDAFVFGSVTKPGAVPFTGSGLTLLQALSGAGMDLTSLTNADLSNIHVIRGNGKTAQFLVVDANLILSGNAASFVLQPGDIVYVPPTAVATWNEVLNQLLPSLQTVSAVLNPFVSIKYLRQ